ncbi:DUF3775 domain-containing protein [Litoreibacter albidus]|uniref:DUF3775 domain-containing protein n=2 Tax=Litoreibacter albidus TaxID=670155 RepID=A0A1H3C7E7_9RHOB|nr:DUF3775 domain-containing protein [Litoreibacter albidus]SDX49980.1 Protein of unknown function [Litoreibacter albidus]
MDISLSKVAQVVLFAHELDRAEGELRAFIDGLNEDEQAELVALAWIGRGSFEPTEWEEALTTARQEKVTPTEDYLLGMPHVADHLETGAEMMGFDLSDAEDDLL